MPHWAPQLNFDVGQTAERHQMPAPNLCGKLKTIVANALQIPPAGFEDLPVEDQVDYVQALWNKIAERPERLPITDDTRGMLEQRLAAHRAAPNEARPWDEVREEIRAALRTRRK